MRKFLAFASILILGAEALLQASTTTQETAKVWLTTEVSPTDPLFKIGYGDPDAVTIADLVMLSGDASTKNVTLADNLLRNRTKTPGEVLVTLEPGTYTASQYQVSVAGVAQGDGIYGFYNTEASDYQEASFGTDSIEVTSSTGYEVLTSPTVDTATEKEFSVSFDGATVSDEVVLCHFPVEWTIDDSRTLANGEYSYTISFTLTKES